MSQNTNLKKVSHHINRFALSLSADSTFKLHCQQKGLYKYSVRFFFLQLLGVVILPLVDLNSTSVLSRHDVTIPIGSYTLLVKRNHQKSQNCPRHLLTSTFNMMTELLPAFGSCYLKLCKLKFWHFTLLQSAAFFQFLFNRHVMHETVTSCWQRSLASAS